MYTIINDYTAEKGVASSNNTFFCLINTLCDFDYFTHGGRRTIYSIPLMIILPC